MVVPKKGLSIYTANPLVRCGPTESARSTGERPDARPVPIDSSMMAQVHSTDKQFVI
jgi:hypothetical protein